MDVSNDFSLNSVPATGQLSEKERVCSCDYSGAEFRILFLGYSITRHALAHGPVGYGEWGMLVLARQREWSHMWIALGNGFVKIVSRC